MRRPDPDEADRAAWRAVGCGWPYGGRQFFRLSAPPPGAAFCRRCFPAGLEGCSEAVESSSGVVLSCLGVLPFVSPGIVDLRVWGFDVRVVTPDSRERGFS